MFYIIYNMIILNLICPGIRVSVPLLKFQIQNLYEIIFSISPSFDIKNALYLSYIMFD